MTSAGSELATLEPAHAAWSSARSLMATEPWKRPWEEQQSPHAQINTPANSAMAADAQPLFASTMVSPIISRRLPPLNASLDVQADSIQQSLPSRRTSVSSASYGNASPGLGWQYEPSPNSKRRRLMSIGHEKMSQGYPPLPLPEDQPHHGHMSPMRPGGDIAGRQEKAGRRGEFAVSSSASARPIETEDSSESWRRLHSTVDHSATCCTVRCMGESCSNLRTLTSELLREFGELDVSLRGAIAGGPFQSRSQTPNVDHVGVAVTLEWMLERVRSNNTGIRSLVPSSKTLLDDPANRRSVDHSLAAFELGPQPRGKASPPKAPVEKEYPSFQADQQPPGPLDVLKPSSTAQDAIHVASRPTSTTGPTPPVVSGITGSSETSSIVQVASENSPPLPGPRESSLAHTQHLQDLQHQVTVKSLALQTLQTEYDALLAKLDRQRTKCMTLEKKFTVSDVEINSLTDDRERLQAQVQMLEAQVEDLTKSRDDARKEMGESGRQYVRIVEMANRLQAQSADERKRWDEERRDLAGKIRVLELSLPSGDSGTVDLPDTQAGAEQLGTTDDAVEGQDVTTGNSKTPNPSSTARPASTVTTALQAELLKLRCRVQTLEAALRSMGEENSSIQEFIKVITTSAVRAQAAMDRALGA